MPLPDYFEFFGIERKLNLDAATLRTRFYELSRELHPDRFTQAGAAERDRALERSAILNDAYRVLRDPVLRAEYVLSAAGVESGDMKRIPPELLEDVFELSEMLEGGAPGDYEAARARVSAMRDAAEAEMRALFERHDAGENVLPQLREVLNRRRYIDNLMRQVEGADAHV